MSFKNLNLDRSLVEKYLADASQNGNLIKSTQKGNQTNHDFLFDGKKCLLIIYYNKDGTTTISHKVGPAQDLSERTAKDIVEACKISDLKQGICTFKNVPQEDFWLIPEFVLGDTPGATCEKRLDGDSEVQLIFKGRSDDQVSLKYYKTTGTALLQGKPLPIFQSVKLFFYEIVSEENIIEIENVAYNINLTVVDLRSSLKRYLPTAYSFLDDKVRKIITSSLVIDNTNISLEDYSCFCFPALRGLEGYIKQLLEKFYKDYNKTYNIGAFFKDKDQNSKFFLQDFVVKSVSCQKAIEAIESSYNFYYSRRHQYFHIEKHVGSTPIIETKEAAQALNVEVFDLIETTFCQIP